MELVIDRVSNGPTVADLGCVEIADVDVLRERAFLVGMLSLADALLGRPIEELVHELRLGEDIARALTHHEGPLGELLLFAQCVERCEIEKIDAALPQWSLDMPSLQTLEHEAYAWVHGLIAAPPA